MRESRALRAAAKLWYVKTLDLRSAIPVPRDSHEVLSGGDDPDRVLLIGNGHTHGWGTMTHELALTGQLARTLSRATGRHTDVSYVGDEMMGMASVVTWLHDTRLEEYDLVLLVMSMNDAVRLTPTEEYRQEMGVVLSKLVAETKPSAQIIVAGIHDVAALPLYRGVIGRIAQRSADRLNAVVRELIGRFDGVRFMELPAPEPEPGRPEGSAGMYAEWANVFEAACAHALREARLLSASHERVAPTPTVWDWAPAEQIVDGAPPEGWSSLQRIVSSAKQHFHTDIAYIAVIDHDQQYFAASTSPNGRSVPLELTHCKVTVQSDDPVIVRNALKDERFSSPFVELTQMRFYAGVPLRNQAGATIGTFCVASALPIGGRDVTEDRLLEYATRAQQELQRLGAGGVEAPLVAGENAGLKGLQDSQIRAIARDVPSDDCGTGLTPHSAVKDIR